MKPYEIGELDQYLLGQGNHYEFIKNWVHTWLKMEIKRVHICSVGTERTESICHWRV